ncbi:hypothetical protein METP2_02190 [Methanosarcinales archaeon]|nr:hypothetical protein METP2_02190 [Methanosarcinales archaeon]
MKINIINSLKIIIRLLYIPLSPYQMLSVKAEGGFYKIRPRDFCRTKNVGLYCSPRADELHVTRRQGEISFELI